MTTPDDQLRARLEADTAQLLQIIAAVAPKAGLHPGEVARLDQLAASWRSSRARSH